MTQLFTNQTANGISSEFTVTGGTGIFYFNDIFDGATVHIEVENAEGTWSPVNGTKFTEPVSDILNVLGDQVVRLRLSGAGANTNINAGITI